MSAETALYAVLSAYAPLTALVSTRIFPDAIPEDKALPAVVYGNEGATPEACPVSYTHLTLPTSDLV